MSEMSDMHKLIMAMELAKTAQVGLELTYFDVIELLGELESLKDYIAELESLVDELKPYRDGYEGEFLEPTDDRFYLIRHTNGQLVTTRKVDNHEDINFLGWGAKGKPRRYWRLPEVHE